MKKYILPVLLVFLFFRGYCQKASGRLNNKMQGHSANDTLKIRRFYNLAQEQNNHDFKKVKDFLHQSYALAKSAQAETWIPELEMNLGRVCANLSMPDSALYYFYRSLDGFAKQNNQKSIAHVYTKIRWVYNYLGDFEKALVYAFKALEIYQKLNDTVGIASSNSDISVIFYSQQKFEDAIKYAEKAYEIQKKNRRLEDLAYTAQALGDAWLQLGNYPKALEYQNEGLTLRRRLASQIDIALSLNSRANVYKYQKRYQEALEDYRESLNIARKASFTSLVLSCLGNIGHVYNLTENYAAALPYHLENQRLIDQTQQLDKAVENYQLLADAYAGLTKYDSAYYYQRLTTTTSQDLLNEQNTLQMSKLKTQFETKQKEDKILLQEKQLAEERLKLWALGFFLIVSIIAGILLFRLIRILRKRNEEKEFLIKEIHHRVRNNLQVLSSLLHLQSRYIKDEAALDAVKEGQNRVDAMGLIHQKLYMGDNLAAVDMSDYLQHLGESLLDSFGLGDTHRVIIQYQLQPIHLDVDSAIPLGLIVNELVTNSLKYAFPHNRSGIVEIALWEESTKKLCLQITDNGVGKSNALQFSSGTSFGLNLVKILSKKLKGKHKIIEAEFGYGTLLEFENYKSV